MQRNDERQVMQWTVLTRNEAFAAVIVPCGFTKAGLSLLICSGVEGRIPLSSVTGLDLPELAWTGTEGERGERDVYNYNTHLVQRLSEHLEAFLSLLPDEQGCGSDLHIHPDLCERYQKLQLSGPQNVPLSHWLKTRRLLGAVYIYIDYRLLNTIGIIPRGQNTASHSILLIIFQMLSSSTVEK